MKQKIFCPVCQVSFLYKDEISTGKEVVCTVCGAILVISQTEPEPVAVRPTGMDPEKEIRSRVDNYASLRKYTFSKDKEDIIEGLLGKYKQFGDFYCPCRFDNIPENICPCLETRQGAVRREGKCL